MNKSINGILMVLLASVLSFSCEKENEEQNEEPFTPVLVIEGNSQALVEGYLINYGADPGANVNLDLFLLTEGVIPVYQNGFPTTFSGEGSVLYLETFTNDSLTLTAGTYNYNNLGTEELFSVGSAKVYFLANNQFAGSQDLIDADLRVEKESNTYTLTGSAEILTNGGDVTYSFQGELPIYDVE